MLPGSPPLARGKETVWTLFNGWYRITPACAGKRTAYAGGYQMIEDHPRLRGEKASGTNLLKSLPGSPPLARGKVLRRFKVCLQFRITPACAGKSRSRHRLDSQNQDHPRLRGEKSLKKSRRPVSKGSPPLARGKALSSAPAPPLGRITPACAGKRG